MHLVGSLFCIVHRDVNGARKRGQRAMSILGDGGIGIKFIIIMFAVILKSRVVECNGPI